MIKKILVATTFLWGMSLSPASGQVLDFENANSFGGDGASVSGQYFDTYGVTVSAMVGKSKAKAESAVLSFESLGQEGGDGFLSSANVNDALSNWGNYFIRAGSGSWSYNNAKYFNMTIDYKEATQAASGQIWGHDGKVPFQVTALDANGNVVASLTSPSSLKQEAWTWSFDASEKEAISTISLEYNSSTKTMHGFAMDNFNPTGIAGAATGGEMNAHAAPLPAALPIGLVSMIAIGVVRMRRNEQQQNTEKQQNRERQPALV